MASLLTILETIDVGKASIFLSSNDNSHGALYGARLSSPSSPITISIVTDALKWMYASNPSESSLRSVANYCYWIYGKYQLQAQNIILMMGGGTVIPITPASRPLALEFIVTTSSVMVDRQSTITIPTFKGYNLEFFRGGVNQSSLNAEDTSYTWDRNTATFTCSPAATAGTI